MHAIQRGVVEEEVVRGVGVAQPRAVIDCAAPLRAEAQQIAGEIEALREAARRKVWEVIVQTREIHARICDASARLEHLQLDIRDRTGEVRLPAVPMPFGDFLVGEIRRFAVTAAVER